MSGKIVRLRAAKSIVMRPVAQKDGGGTTPTREHLTEAEIDKLLAALSAGLRTALIASTTWSGSN
jgi:hypothetical protein